MTTKAIASVEQSFRMPVSRTPGLRPSSVASNEAAPARSRQVPLFISADEAYYWSSPWQRDVMRSMKALREGDYEDFDSDDPTDVARWLLSVDEAACD